MNIYKIWGICLFFVVSITACLIYFSASKSCVKSGTVIVLNGPSSVGKTSIIKAFQAQCIEPWLNIGIDNFFVGVLPAKFYIEDKSEHHKVMHGVASVNESGNKVFTLEIGPEGQKVICGMHAAIAAYARAGNNIIVDYIAYRPEWIKDLKKNLTGLNVIYVGVNAPLDVIEQREKIRGTSPHGHARSHYNTVHRGFTYDLILNSSELSPEQAAKKIANYKLGAGAESVFPKEHGYAGARLIK